MSEQITVYKATYSHVPVYEITVKDVSIMRRREDDYINATQILKVAAFGKAQRTRILEREVQVGLHEKIQGGYGKYQGTWIPIDRAKELCRRYDVYDTLSPLLLFTPGPTSPPPAPKHAITHHTKPRMPKKPKMTAGKPFALAAVAPQHLPPHHAPPPHVPHGYVHPYHYQQANGRPLIGHKAPPGAQFAYPPHMMAFPPHHPHHPPPPHMHHPQQQPPHGHPMAPPMAHLQHPHLAAPTPSSSASSSAQPATDDPAAAAAAASASAAASAAAAAAASATPDPPTTEASARYDDASEQYDSSYESDEPYESQLLRHFISGDPRVPSLLMHPPPDLDFNVIIDDEGHTSLHWAAAMGHLKIVKLLLHHGADVSRVNYKGQTALIRAVLFTNNFERRCFPHMLEMLRKTIFNIDKKDQTVFHHIASTAGWKGKVHASRYYMDCLMERIRATNKDDLVQILNVQDVYGDTALTIASRIGNKKLVRLLVEAGANPQLVNEEGKTSQDYILEMDGYYQSLGHQPGPDEDTRKRARQRVDDVLLAEANADQDTANSTAKAENAETVENAAENAGKESSQPPSTTATASTAPTLSSRWAVPGPTLRDHSKIVEECIYSFERDQEHKDQLLRELTSEVQMVKKRLEITVSTLNRLSYDKRSMDEISAQADTMQHQLHQLLEYTQQKQLLRLVQQHVDRPDAFLHTLKEDTVGQEGEEKQGEPMDTSSDDEKEKKTPLSVIVPNDKAASPSLKRRVQEILDESNLDDLTHQWKDLRDTRRAMIQQVVQLQRQMPNKRYQDYKRLISMCCNVNYENVDVMLSPLLASFEQSEIDQRNKDQQDQQLQAIV
ncbi:hypothetical protein BC940DRAFT_312286 [Gongronella butleri]|nr:hypothetical protein BC940DRAFT_312286 [Gongronella butleri]